MGESGAAISEGKPVAQDGLPWFPGLWVAERRCAQMCLGVPTCAQVSPYVLPERCPMPAMHPLRGSGAEGLQGLIPTQPWAPSSYVLPWDGFFFVKKLFYAFAGVRGTDVRKEDVQVSKPQGDHVGRSGEVVMHGKREFNAAWQLPLWGISAVPWYALGYAGSDTALSG